MNIDIKTKNTCTKPATEESVEKVQKQQLHMQQQLSEILKKQGESDFMYAYELSYYSD